MTENMFQPSSIIDDINISSTWHVVDCENGNLKRTVTLNSSCKSVDLDDIVQLDTCIKLIFKKNSEKVNQPCTISITIPESVHYHISQLVVVSEARILEVFGVCGEYIATCQADYVDDFEDCAVYMANCSFKPTSQLLVKFQKTKHADSMWLYGINLKLHEKKPTLPHFSSINFPSVNAMLKEAKIPISDNAEKCKAFMQAYSGVFDQTQSVFKNKPDPQILIKMLEMGILNPLGETGSIMSKCMSNFVPVSMKDSSLNKTTPESAEQNNCGQSNDVFLKIYIDRRFSELENKIDRFEQILKEIETRQNEKLDSVLSLLRKHRNKTK